MNKLITYKKEREEMRTIGKKLVGLSMNPLITWMEGVIYLRGLKNELSEVIKSLEKDPS